jgi:hypothetical protein
MRLRIFDLRTFIIEALKGRRVERRRSRIAREVREARLELEAGRCSPVTPAELLDKILS